MKHATTCGVIVLSLVLAVAACSAVGAVEFAVDDVDLRGVSPGQAITVPIRLDGADPALFSGFQFMLEFDPEILRFAGATHGPLLGAEDPLWAEAGHTPRLWAIEAGVAAGRVTVVGMLLLDGVHTTLGNLEVLDLGRIPAPAGVLAYLQFTVLRVAAGALTLVVDGVSNPLLVNDPLDGSAGPVATTPAVRLGALLPATPPDWAPPPGYATSMMLYARVLRQPGNHPIETEGSLLAAFKDGVCRGVAPIAASPTGPTWSLQVLANQATEPGFTLKVWDAFSGEIYDLVETFDFVDGAAWGELPEPVILNPVAPPGGALQVTILPEAAAAAGAAWSPDGGATWYPSGSTASDLPGGDAVVAFEPLPGWNAPGPLMVAIVPGETTVATGTYVRATYTLTYAAGAGGSVQGPTPQTVSHGDDGAAVTAIPDAENRFVQWSDGQTGNPRVDASVTADLSVTAAFAPKLVPAITWPAPAPVLYGIPLGPTQFNATADTAGSLAYTPPAGTVLPAGAHTLRVDLSPDDPATWASAWATVEITVLPAPLTCTAENKTRQQGVANPPFSIAYTGLQNVDTAPAVPPLATCAADAGSPPGVYPLVLSGGSDPNYVLTLLDGVLTVTAAVEVPPNGDFEVVFLNAANPGGRCIWDLTGAYATALGAYTLQMDFDHDARGRLVGIGRMVGPLPSAVVIDVPLTIKGKAAGKGAAVTATLSLSGKTQASAVKATLAATLEGSNLAGTCSASVSDKAGGKEKIARGCSLPLDAAMTGDFQLALALSQDAKGKITGDGVLALSNGRALPVLVSGSRAKGAITIQVAGNKALDPQAGAVALKLTVQTLSNGTAEVRQLSGKAFGQTLNWP